MSDGDADAAAVAAPPTAGRLLREAREKQGLHIAALAAAIKVSQKKLEALEADRFSELPDATFTRALAQTVCRALKVDASAVMQRLPPPAGHRLEMVGEGLNTPFRERPGALVQRDWTPSGASPTLWIVVLILVATATVYFLPASLITLTPARSRPGSTSPARPGEEGAVGSEGAGSAAAPASAASAALSPAASGAAAILPVGADAGTVEGAASAVGLAPETPAQEPVATGVLQLYSSAPSWVEVTDAQGKALVSRLLRAGESVDVDGAPPLRLRIGNAAGTQVTFRGQPTDLQAFTRDNVARLELK